MHHVATGGKYMQTFMMQSLQNFRTGNANKRGQYFATPFNVVVAAVPSNFQYELSQLQTDDTLNVMHR